MSADGESAGKSKGRKARRDEADIDELIDKDGRLDLNELETAHFPIALLSVSVAFDALASRRSSLLRWRGCVLPYSGGGSARFAL